jgi:hypothetical protein
MSETRNDGSRASPVAPDLKSDLSDYHNAADGDIMDDTRSDTSRLVPQQSIEGRRIVTMATTTIP